LTKLTKFLLGRSLLIHYITIVIVALGLFALVKMRREARPAVNFDRIAVTVGYNGASATDVEELILKPIEDEIDAIDGIEEYRSTGFEGIASMSIKLDPDYPEKEDIVDEVQRAIDQVSLPEDASDPIVKEIKASKITVYSLALMGDVPPLTLRTAAKKLERELKKIEGVSTVDISGLEELEYRIQVKPDILNAKSVGIGEIMTTLRNWNRVSPGGEVDLKGKTFAIRLDEQLKTKESIENLTIRANDAGVGVKIKDIGTVNLQTKELKQEQLVNGKRGVSLSIKKAEAADIVTVVDSIKDFLKDYNFEDGIEPVVYYDDSVRIANSLKSVFLNAGLGLALVLISLMLFVSTRLALVTSIGMPIAFLGGVFTIFVLGMTLNSLVVLGMIVVLGMLVDDAIVVAENIYSYIERGETPRDAAVKGVAEVASPVLATVMTTVFAFLPVVYMEGVMGQFLKVIPITVIFILAFSLFEALIILPTHCAEILKQKKDADENQPNGPIERLREKYVAFVKWSIGSKVSLSMIVLSFVVLVGATAVVRKKVKFELFPRSGVEYLNISAEFPINTAKEKSKDFVQKLYAEFKKQDFFGDIFAMSSQVGSISKGGVSGSREQGSHLSQTTLRLTDDPDFVYREDEVVEKVKKTVELIAKETGAKASVGVPRRGPPTESDIQVLITSPNFAKSTEATDALVAYLKSQKENQNVQSDLMTQTQFYKVKIDKALAVESGLRFADISSTVFSAFYGAAATTTRVGEDEVDLVVSFDSQSRQDIKSLEEIKFNNARGVLVPLKSFAQIEMDSSTPSIQRLDGARAVSVFGDVDELSFGQL